jgi:predicted DNA-binding transcriptional regulator YafY
VSSAELTGEACVRPKGFDLAEYWEQSTVSFKTHLPQYPATMRAHPDIFPRMSYAGRFARIEHADPPDADGWIRVAMRFDVEEMAIEYALSFGPLMEVLEPEALREKVINAAKSVVAFYAERAG